VRLKKSSMSLGAKNRPVHCWGGRIGSALGKTAIFKRVDTEHACIRAGVSCINWLFFLLYYYYYFPLLMCPCHLCRSEITIRLDESDALSASSCHDGESERFVSTGSTGRRVSFNESALYEQEKTTQDKGRRYSSTKLRWIFPLSFAWVWWTQIR